MKRNIGWTLGLVTFIVLYAFASKVEHDNADKEQREREADVALVGALHGACSALDGAILMGKTWQDAKCVKGAYVLAEFKEEKLTIYRKTERPLIDGDRREV